MARTLVASAAVAAVAATTASISLDFGWRFFLGSETGGVCTTPYSVNLNNFQCMGLTNAPNAQSLDQCVSAACSQGAQVYQWCPDSTCGGPTCWVGAANDCNTPGNGWISNATANNTVWTPPAAAPTFDDSAWQVVDLPHDFEILGQYNASNDQGEAFLPYNVSFYRKHLVLDPSWQGSHIEVYVEGALSANTWWYQGVQLTSRTSGYTSAILRLDNVPGIVFGAPSVLVAFVDGTEKTGWWYEGAGLFRHVKLTVSPASAYATTHGLAAPSYVSGNIYSRATPADGLYADLATMQASLHVANDATTNTTGVQVAFTVYAADGITSVASGSSKTVTLTPGSSETLEAVFTITNVELWSVPRPYLHTIVATVAVGGTVQDSVNGTIGVRSVTWDPNLGLILNNQRVKMRGFCNHESFAAVGAALPARVDLLRVQQMRGLGGNAWRTSHNAPEIDLLELTDRLGIMVMDENRVFATTQNCEGCADVPLYSGNPVADMAELVSRDKLHASVLWWSFCNEAGCGNGATEPALDFKMISYQMDGSRAVGANMGWISPTVPTNMSAILDVWGCSHCGLDTMQNFHELEPMKPMVMSECCSCETQRGEDADLPHNSSVFYPNENSACVSGQTQTSNAPDFISGTMVWTLHDYYGEPDKWPHISSSFGSYDLAGFPKAPVYWYRSWWFGNISTNAADRPPVPNTSTFVRIVESWQPPASGTTRSIHVYSNAAQVSLMLNGALVAGPVAMPPFGAVNFPSVTFAPGNLTAQALDGSGAVLATHTIHSWGAAAAIVLTLDAPNPASGTGSAVYLDGQDVALVRATVVDAFGVTVHDSADNITFTVTNGPAQIWGCGNGDPSNHDPNNVPWKPAYHGLVRAVVRTNVNAAGSAAQRAALAAVNVDAGAGSGTSSIMQGSNAGAPTSFTVTASAPGLQSASITVTLSVDPADSVFAVAAASIASAFTGE